jgi:hypothetical protein
MVKSLGNVNEDTEITFEYRVKPIEELLKMQDFDLTTTTALPF